MAAQMNPRKPIPALIVAVALGGALAALLLVYLTVALARPEKF